MSYIRNMNKDIESFLLRRADLANSTRKLYRFYLEEFAYWTKLNHLDWQKVSDDHLITWLNEHTGWSDSTRYNATEAIKSFYHWRFGESHKVCSVHVKRRDPGPQRTLDWENLQTLLASIDTSTPKGVRDLSLITMMVDTGLRASEVCRLDLKYVDLKNKRATVMVKGGYWGTAVFFDYADSCLRSWLAIRQNFALEEVSTVYVSIKGIKPGTPMTKDGLRAIFRQLGKHADLGLISPHDMRRTFATLATKAGAPSRVVQQAGRWSSIKMVERYTKALDPVEMEEYSPINKVMGI